MTDREHGKGNQVRLELIGQGVPGGGEICCERSPELIIRMCCADLDPAVAAVDGILQQPRHARYHHIFIVAIGADIVGTEFGPGLSEWSRVHA